jgi:hypothetical protein
MHPVVFLYINVVYLTVTTQHSQILFALPLYNEFIDINLLHVSVYKRPSSGKYTLLTHFPTTELRGHVCRSNIIIANTLDTILTYSKN